MKKWIVLISIVCFAIACQENQNQSDTEEDQDEKMEQKEGITLINGVERSELALTMRDMYNQMKSVRDSLQAGQDIKTNYLERYKSIHTDHATEPEKIDELYQGMAANFLARYEAFEHATDDRPTAFNQMLDACLACHQQKCPGPVKAINKLKLNEG